MFSKALLSVTMILAFFIGNAQASYDVFLNQSQNFVMAAPSGSAGNMFPRLLVASDIPALPYASSTLTSSHFYVGNGGNVATDTAMSGDATLANTGAVTLATVNASPGTFTYATLTVNGKGLVTSASSGAAPLVLTAKVKTTTYTAVSGDVVLANATGGAFAVTLPSAATASQIIYVKKTDSSANAVTITAAGADVIDGQATQPLTTQYDDVEMISDGVTHWFVL